MRPDPSPFPATETGSLIVTRGKSSRLLSTTSALRFYQLRKESEQSALNELNVMTEQLLSLPQRLYESGIARQQAAQLQQTMAAYTRLAMIIWEGVATDSLADVYSSAMYRQYFTGANRAVNALLQETANIRPSVHEVIKPTAPLFWKARIARYQSALLLWRTAIGLNDQRPPDLGLMGYANEALRTAVGLGQMGSGGLLLAWATNLVTFVSGISISALLMAATASAFTIGQTRVGTLFAIFTAFLLLFVGVTLWAASSSVYAVQSVTGAVHWRLSDRDDRFGSTLLAGWRWLIQLVFLLSITGAVVVGIRAILLTLPSMNGNLFSGTFLFYFEGFTFRVVPYLITLAGIALAQPWVASLPLTISYQVMLSSELARGKDFLPASRTPFLQPALQMVVYHIFWLLTIITGAFTIAHVQLPILVATPYVHISLLGGILVAVIAILYGVAIELPFRLGSRSYKRNCTAIIARQQSEAKKKLAEIGPTPDQVGETQAYQYNVSRMEYLRMQVDDLRRLRLGPYRWWELVIALTIIVASVTTIENGRDWISQLFR